MTGVRLRVLGPFTAVDAHDRTLDLGGPRQRAVLALLVLAGGRVVPTDRIVDDLWRGEPPPKAMGSLQAYVSHLRRALEPDRAARTPAEVLVSASPGYALRLPADAVDAWEFERLVRDGAGLVDEAPAQAKGLLDRAAALWRGPAYAEFVDEEWAAAEIARLDELRVLAVEQRAEAALALGMAAESVPDLEMHTARHPLREDAWRLFALALYRSGRQGDALAALRRAREVLAEEIGVDPGPSLTQLERAIFAQSPELDRRPPAGGSVPSTGPAEAQTARPVALVPETLPPSLATVDAAPAPAPPGLFVGRAAEQQTLGQAADEVMTGSARLVLVAGEPGAGKSTLLEQFAWERGRDGWRVAWGRCPEVEGAPAAWPWIELVRGLATVVRPRPELALALSPLLRDDLATPTGDAGAARFHLLRSTAAYLGEIAADAPLLVVLDDLHRADAESLAMLTGVAAAVADRPVLLVCAYRGAEVTDGLRTAFGELARLSPARVDLTGLNVEEVAELVSSVAEQACDHDVAESILARTDGNPFYVHETARLLASEGRLVAVADVPAGVRDVIRRRLARLPAHAQTVLRLGAVMGRDVDVDVLLAAEGTDDEDSTLDAIEAGLIAGLLVEPDLGRVRFAHALVRDTLYEDISRLRRSRLHGRVAEVMERVRPDDLAGLAHHYREAASAGSTAKAIDYACRAAEQAESRYAFVGAAELWRNAVQLHERLIGSDPAERVEMLIRLVRAHGQSGSLVTLREVRHRAIDTAASTGDALLVSRAVTSWDTAVTWSNRKYAEPDLKVLEWIATALTQVPERDIAQRARLLAARAMELEGEFDPVGRASADEAVALARSLRDPELLAFALMSLCWQLWGPHPKAERLAVVQELHELATEHLLVGYHTYAHYCSFQIAFALGDLETARWHADQSINSARRFRMRDGEVAARFIEPLEALVRGDYPAAERLYADLCDRLAEIGAWNTEMGMRWACPLTVRHAQGRLAEMEESTRLTAEALPAAGASALVRVLLAAGKVEEARERWHRLPPQRPDLFWGFYSILRAESAMLLGDDAAAAAIYDGLLPDSGELGGAGCGIFTFGPVDLTLAELAEHLGRPQDARRHWADAQALAERVGWRQYAVQAAEAVERLDRSSSRA